MRIITLLIALGVALSSFQIIKTHLHITVNDDSGKAAEGVTIQLFETEEDYNAEKNVVAEAVTDKDGLAKLKDLKEAEYFVLARKGDLNNFTGLEHIPKLDHKKINKVTIVIN